MILTTIELQDLFQAVIQNSGHPDPVGYLARVLLTSGADPTYVSIDGKLGFLPVHPNYAVQLVGATDVQSLEGNVTSTMAMDIILFQDLMDLEAMVIAFHDGLDAETTSEATQEILNNLEEAKVELYQVLFPRAARVEDVINMLSDGSTELTKKEELFFEGLTNG